MRYVFGQPSTTGGRDRSAAGVLLAGITSFQLALAAGAPWGRVAWGGGHEGALPTDLRVASAGAAVLWGAATVAVATQRPRSPRGQLVLLRGVGAACAVGAALNLVSPSPGERALWAPVSAAVAVLTWRASRGLVSDASAGRVG